MRIFLLHGMARTPASMGLLAWRLRRAGHTPHLFGYTVLTQKLSIIAERFAERVERVLERDSRGEGGKSGEDIGSPQPYAVIGHSLGNVITRLASPLLPLGFHRFVMLAPPNRSPAIARALGKNPVYRAVTRDAGRRLLDEAYFHDLPTPSVPALVIAGNRGPRASWLPFDGAPNDAILRVDETLLDGASLLEVPGVHTFLMNRQDVLQAILDFLAAGALTTGAEGEKMPEDLPREPSIG